MALRQAAFIPILVFGILGSMMSCSEAPTQPGAGQGVAPNLPDGASGWRAVDGGQIYDTESIYSYIDGHAEVYMAYGMLRCLSRRYEGPEGEPDIVLDLFEQASPADAFGVFTHDRDGTEVEVGQGGRVRFGWLSFWKGSWFGSVYAEGESEAAAEAVIEIGRAAADAIADVGEPSPLVAELPVEGLDQRSVVFLHTQEILNGVVYLGYDNPLQLGPDVDAVLGWYERPDGNAWLLVADYPDEATAKAAENGAEGAGIETLRSASRLAAVLSSEPSAVADELLADVTGGD